MPQRLSPFHSALARRPLRRSLCVLSALTLAGCASGGLIDKSLELVGLKKPEPPAGIDPELALAKLQPRQVTLRIHAGQVLNTDATGRTLSLVTRIYMLRATTQFSQATYPMFSSNSADKPAFTEEVVSVKEVVLTPGQKYERVEPVPLQASHIAVVALFRAPDSQRWRFVFETKPAMKSGITIGAHGCALSVAAGEPLDVPPESLRLAGVQCR